jgi:uncharacterized membrane protein
MQQEHDDQRTAKVRDASVDALRGIAILTMIEANLAASLLMQPHPLLLRLFGSFAAPLFIVISGMMVEYTSRTKGYGLTHFLFRGLSIVGVGVLVDVMIWKIYPFTTVDVLYLVGISIPLAYLFSRLRSPPQWTITAAIFALAPILQVLLGYSDYPTEYTLLGQITVIASNQTSILNHWLVDGWFPIFPWLGFSLLGVALARVRWSPNLRCKLGDPKVFLVGLVVTGLGALIWFLYPGSLLVRAGYSELFYPPMTGYVLAAVGLVVILFGLVDRTASSRVYAPLQMMGPSSLFIYFLHHLLIEYVFSQVLQPQNMEIFIVAYVVLLVAMVLVAYVLRILKTRGRIE